MSLVSVADALSAFGSVQRILGELESALARRTDLVTRTQSNTNIYVTGDGSQNICWTVDATLVDGAIISWSLDAQFKKGHWIIWADVRQSLPEGEVSSSIQELSDLTIEGDEDFLKALVLRAAELADVRAL